MSPKLFALMLALVGPVPKDAPTALQLKQGDQIVAIGDSITAEGGYLKMTDAVLAQNYPDLKVPPIINAGIGGQKSEDLLARFQKDVVDRKPAFVTIKIGINDVWHRLDAPHDPKVLESYKANVAKMVDMAQQANIKVILLTPTIIGESSESEGNKRLALYAAAEKDIAADKKCRIVDLHQIFLDMLAKRPADLQGAWLAHDGVHMNDRGNTVMAIALLRALGVAKPFPDTTSTCESENLLANGEQIKADGKFIQATRFGSTNEDLTAFGITWARWPGSPPAKYHRAWGNYPIDTVDAKGAKFTGAANELVKWILGVNYGTIAGTFTNLTPGKRYRAQFIVNDNHFSRDEIILCAGIRAGEMETGISKHTFPIVVTFEWTATRAAEEWTCSGREGHLVGFALFELEVK